MHNTGAVQRGTKFGGFSNGMCLLELLQWQITATKLGGFFV